tara:strand:+ start:7497 stop:8003 length:507 start_codon:yes stop_codon:yes gene_type:complete
MTLTNALADAAESIRALVTASDAAAIESIEKAIEAGHALASAKAEAPHGTWLPFLERAGVQERKAQRLMKLAASGLKSDTVSDLGGMKAALTFITKRDKAARLMCDVEFKGWHEVLERAIEVGGSPELTEGIDKDVLHRDMGRLMEAMQLMEECHGMFGDEAAAARAA